MVVEADDQLRPVLQQHASVAFRAGQPPLPRAGLPLSTPVDRVTPVTVLRQAVTFAPQVRRLIRPLAAPSITTSCSPCRAASRSSTASTVPGHGQRRLPHTSTRGSLSSTATTRPPTPRTEADDDTDDCPTRQTQIWHGAPACATPVVIIMFHRHSR
jgi:hypothetical protein